MSIVVVIISNFVGAIWWRYHRKLAAVLDCEKQHEPGAHDQDRAEESSEIYPDLTDLNGWAGTGDLRATLVVHGFASYETDRLT